jgi:hypothetical protein
MKAIALYDSEELVAVFWAKPRFISALEKRDTWAIEKLASVVDEVDRIRQQEQMPPTMGHELTVTAADADGVAALRSTGLEMVVRLQRLN